jgi:Ca2+/Na+ antiporter
LRSSFPIDVAAYGRAFVLLVRNPLIALAPLVANVVQILLLMLFPVEIGSGFLSSANAGLAGLIGQLVGSFGLAVALIVASTAWRRGRAPFDDAWDEARRKMGDILFAAIGFGFVIYIASLVGGFLGGYGALALTLVAYFFFIYTMPAAAIGGVPGGAALNVSVERARRAPLPTLVVTAVYVLAFAFGPTLALQALAPLLVGTSIFASDIASRLLIAVLQAIVSAYVALVLAKTYEDVSYGRSF